MRLLNLRGRAALSVGADGQRFAVDVGRASNGALPSDPMELLERFEELVDWAASAGTDGAQPFDALDVRAPVPRPRQVFAVALNYRPHIEEAGYTPPSAPLIFTKFPSCIAGPYDTIELPPGRVDWEIELVAVVGRPTYRVVPSAGWAALAGVTVGQDLSERTLQLQGKPAQFAMGKSYPGFGPMGPELVTADELEDPDDLTVTTILSGEKVQAARTSDMIFPVPALVSWLSHVCPLSPGDVIFTGTPGGVGLRRDPPRFIQDSDELVSTVEGVGEMRHRFTTQTQAALFPDESGDRTDDQH